MIYCEHCGTTYPDTFDYDSDRGWNVITETITIDGMEAECSAHILRCPACKLFDWMQEQGKRIEDLARGMRAIQQVQWRLEKGD